MNVSDSLRSQINSGGSMMASTSNVPCQGDIALASDRVRGILNLLNSTNETLIHTSNRLQGTKPMSGENSTESAVRESGEIPELLYLLDDLYAAAGRTSDITGILARI